MEIRKCPDGHVRYKVYDTYSGVIINVDKLYCHQCGKLLEIEKYDSNLMSKMEQQWNVLTNDHNMKLAEEINKNKESD